MPHRTEIIRDPEEIRLLKIPWNQLAGRLKTPLLRNEWFTACAEAFCQPGQLHVIVNNSETEIDAIAALVLAQSHGTERLMLLGSSFLSEPNGLIYRNEESLKTLIKRLLRTKRPLILNRLRSDSSEISILREVSKENGAIILLRNDAGSPYLPITTTWTLFKSSMNSRQRYDLRRAKNRSKNLGKVQVEILSPAPASFEHCFEEMLHVEAAGWKGRAGTALLFDERLRNFFYLYSRAASQLGTLRLCFLRINNKPAASLLAVEYFNRFWVLKIGYDEAFSKCSPGILLTNETIRYAFENGLESYEFLGSDAPWIHMWTQLKHSYVTARIYPFSICGQVGLGYDIISAVAKKATRTISGKKHALLAE